MEMHTFLSNFHKVWAFSLKMRENARIFLPNERPLPAGIIVLLFSLTSSMVMLQWPYHVPVIHLRHSHFLHSLL